MNRRNFLKSAVFGTASISAAGSKGAAVSVRDGRMDVEPAKKFYTIDGYGHFSSKKYIDLLEKLSGEPYPSKAFTLRNPAALDPVVRMEAMDQCGMDATVMVPGPFIESVPDVYNDPVKALQAAQFMNNEMAAIVSMYPKRFLGVALLPTTNSDVMLSEFERAVTRLHMIGACFVVSPVSKTPDHPDFLELYSMAAELNVPLWIHPDRPSSYPDYLDEKESKNSLHMMIGWPVDSSIAMCRIAFSGIFDKYPDLKIIIHHRGGLIPSWWSRIVGILTVNEKFMTVPDISKPYVNHLKKFYCDTASSGHEPELLKLAYDFFGPDKVIYGTDSPNDGNKGITMSNNARYDVTHMGISDVAMSKVFSKNLLRIIPGL